MRVLFVIPNYEPAWAFGGVVRCISTLCRSMAEIGVDVTVYTTNIDGRGGVLPGNPGVPTCAGGVTVRYFPSTFGLNSAWDSRALIRTLMQSILNFDIIYISAMWQWIGISASRVAQRHRVPYVIGTHGSFDEVLLRVSRKKKMIYYHVFLKKCILGASAIHFTTEYERRESPILRLGPPSFLAPNCMRNHAFEIDPSLAACLRKEFSIPNNAPLLLNVGRPDPKKRLDILLNAFRNVLVYYPDSQLMIVGSCDNAYARQMKALSDTLGLVEKVIWAGYRTGDDLDACYTGADLFILPSIDENFGMVITEAMACGLPVVVSDRVGVAEDVKRHNAGIVTSVSTQQVTSAVLDLLRDRSRYQQMSGDARKAARQLFSGERVARLTLKAFEDVLSKSRSTECAWQ